jgi:hypothetical protein
MCAFVRTMDARIVAPSKQRIRLGPTEISPGLLYPEYADASQPCGHLSSAKAQRENE